MDNAQTLVEKFGSYDPKLDLPNYKFPTLELLTQPTSQPIINTETLDHNKQTIVEVLQHNNLPIELIKATVGPSQTLYEIKPARGTKVSRIKNLETDLALHLAAHVRVIGPIPGKGTMGIEMSHPETDRVFLRSVIATSLSRNGEMELPIAFGKKMDNEVYIADLANLPHLLIAGATGQGKSVFLNTLIASLIYKKHPSELKLLLIDTSQLEFSLFRKIERHFLASLPDQADPIISDVSAAVDTLTSLCIELDERHKLMKSAGARNLKEYNQKFINRKLDAPSEHRYMPYIVLVIDEFAELLQQRHEIEPVINRLAQQGRPAGIHLVISTQRPSVNILTGTIKANFNARLAFRVVSPIDSRTILDASGAEELRGQGDMLFHTGTEIIHLQSTFAETEEIKNICGFIGDQQGYPGAFFLPEYDNGRKTEKAEFDPGHTDPLFEDCARLIVIHQQASISLIQRKFKLGYNRSGRIIDQLEGAGIIGPFEGSKARDVYFTDEYALERFLEGKQPAPSTEPEPTIATQPQAPETKTTATPDPEKKQPTPPESKPKSFWQRLFSSNR